VIAHSFKEAIIEMMGEIAKKIPGLTQGNTRKGISYRWWCCALLLQQ